jgi:hypothetical protein
MKSNTPALWLSLGLLATSSAGCISLARESYTSLRGPGATAVEPGDPFEVSAGRLGHAISQSLSLARATLGSDASVSAAICDWDPGIWFIVFPPLPIPLLTLGDSGGAGRTIVRLTFDGKGTWRAAFDQLSLTGPDGARATPRRYRLVTKAIDTSLEPCSRAVDPRTDVEGAELAVFGQAELWLRFDTLDWPEGTRTLELGGLSFESSPLPATRLELEPGSRWFWYRVFP